MLAERFRVWLPGLAGAAFLIGVPCARAQQGPPPRPPHVAADVAFMQGMIAHHAQALEMTALVAERTTTHAIMMLAERIDVSQTDEIALMQAWLRDRAERVPGPHDHHAHGDHGLMPGMLTAAQMERLRAARGAEFDRLFLELMIQHHEGALRMVRDLFAADGAGQEPAIFQFASEVDSDQTMEIDRMRQLLGTLTRGERPR